MARNRAPHHHPPPRSLPQQALVFAASLAILDLVYDGMFLSKFAAMEDQRPFFAQVVIMIGSGLGRLGAGTI